MPKGKEVEVVSGNEVNVKSETSIVRKLAVTPVSIVDAGIEVSELDGLPEEFKRGETLTGFPPSPKWEKAGEALFGYYVGQRNDVGPNASRLYEIAVPRKGEEPVTCAVWGSSALDRLVDSCYPALKSGDKVAIIYLGEKDTRRGLNPVKLFALKVVRADGKTQNVHAA